MCILASALLTKLSDVNMRKNCSFTVGQIVDMKRALKNMRLEVSDSYSLVIAYSVNGREYREKIGFNTKKDDLIKNFGIVGEYVQIYYSNDDPSKFRIINEVDVHIRLTIIIGSVFSVMGLYCVYLAPKRH